MLKSKQGVGLGRGFWTRFQKADSRLWRDGQPREVWLDKVGVHCGIYADLGVVGSNECYPVNSRVCGNRRFGFPALDWCMPQMYCVLNMTRPQSSKDTG